MKKSKKSKVSDNRDYQAPEDIDFDFNPNAEINDELAERNIDKLFALLDDAPSQGRSGKNTMRPASKKALKSKRVSDRLTDNSVAIDSVLTTVSSLASLLDPGHAVSIDDTVPDIDLTGKQVKKAQGISWDDSVAYRLLLQPFYTFVSRLSLVDSLISDSSQGSTAGAQSLGDNSVCEANSAKVSESLAKYKGCLQEALRSLIHKDDDFLTHDGPRIESVEETLVEEKQLVDKMGAHLQELRDGVAVHIGKGKNSANADESFPYDQAYWRYRATKNRSNIPINGSRVVPAYNASIYNDDDLVKQFQMQRKNKCLPPLGFTADVSCLTKTREEKKSISVHQKDDEEIEQLNESSQVHRLKNFCSAASKKIEPSSAVIDSLFAD